MDPSRNGDVPKTSKPNPDTVREPEKTFRTALPQILATLAKNLILLTYGLTLGFPTIVIPALSESAPNATLHLSKTEVSWFGSINLITVPLGCLVSGLVTQPFGRKRSMQALTIPFFLVWIMFYYAESVDMLYASLALTGLAGGLLEAPVLTYVAEITQPHLRGFLSATSSLSVIIGIFFQFLMGTFLDWRTLSLVNATCPIAAFIALCFIPESPHWLIGKERLCDAEKSLCWLRGWRSPQEIQAELESLVEAVRPDLYITLKPLDKTPPVTTDKPNQKFCNFSLDNYRKPTFYKPFLLIAFCFFSGHFCGMTTLTTYAVDIFATLGSPVDKYFATMVLGIVQMVATLTCVLMIHYIGKRPIAFISSLGSCLSFGMIGLYSYFYLGVSVLDQGKYYKATFADANHLLSWIPLVGLLSGAFFAYMGVRLLPWVLIGEVYPPEIRGFASGCSGAVGYILGFASNKTFYTLIDTFTLPGVYMFYGLVALFSFGFFFFVLPETEGWTLLAVQQHFSGERNLVKAGRRKSEIQSSGAGRMEEAEKALCWLRGWVSPTDVHKEFEEVKATVKANTWTTTSTGNNAMEKIKVGCQKFRKRTFLRPFSLVVTCFFIGNFTGVSSLATYAVPIFTTLGTPIDRYYATCLLGVAQILGSLTCAGTIHYTGKRPLVIASTLGNCVFFSGVAFYAYFYAGVFSIDGGAAVKANFPNGENYLSWVPMVCLIAGSYCAFSCARLLPWIIMGEIFPGDIRGLASGIAASTYYVFGFFANKTYFVMVDGLTLPGIYWLHSFVAFMGAVFYYFCLPETEGWTLYEVEEHFAGKRDLVHAGKRKTSCAKVEGHDNMGLEMNKV